MIYELHKTRLHILNFAVEPGRRRLGIGAQMVEKLINKLSQQRRHEIVLEVRETNLPAQLFFQTQGFRAVQVLRNHYHDSAEDAYLMQYRMEVEELANDSAPVNRIASL
jgi:ribosomal-protein-alanine N-acetyltransferase